MKIKLSIGHTEWIVPDATKAAKVVDLLGSFVPIKRDWSNSDKTVFVIGRHLGYHDLSIEELGDEVEVVKTVAAAIKLRKPTDQ